MANVFPGQAIPLEVRVRKEKRDRLWEVSLTARQFVEDYYPCEWEEVRRCKNEYLPYVSKTREDRWKLGTRSCHKVPMCVPCSNAAGMRRAFEAMDKLREVTPKGKSLRVIPWTLTTMSREGVKNYADAASRDLNRYAKAVSIFLHHVYEAEEGELGWVMSYQDFGERAFKRKHPHWHVTVAGSLWRGGVMEPLPRVELRGSGAKKLRAVWDESLATMFPGAESGDFRVEEPAVGAGRFFDWLKYETRELVDLRKVEYDRMTMTVGWKSYHSDHVRTMFVAPEFWRGIEEYRQRVRPEVPNVVHRECGYLVGAQRSVIGPLVGGEAKPHDVMTCSCRKCDEWVGVPSLRDYAMGREPGPADFGLIRMTA